MAMKIPFLCDVCCEFVFKPFEGMPRKIPFLRNCCFRALRRYSKENTIPETVVFEPFEGMPRKIPFQRLLFSSPSKVYQGKYHSRDCCFRALRRYAKENTIPETVHCFQALWRYANKNTIPLLRLPQES